MALLYPTIEETALPEHFEENDFEREILNKYFKNKEVLVKHHIESYNDFLERKIPNIFEEYNTNPKNVILADYDQTTDRYNLEYHIKFGNHYIAEPSINDNDGSMKPMTPKDARDRGLTYSSNLYVDIYQRVIKHHLNKESEIIDLPMISQLSIGKIPIMLHCKRCILYNKKGVIPQQLGECKYDYGGYFIINGSEKVVIPQEKKSWNQVHIFSQGKASSPKYSHIAEISSMVHNKAKSPHPMAVKYTAKEGVYGRTFKVQIQNIKKDIPLFVLFRALGITSDKEIVEYIVNSVDLDSSREMMELLLPSLEEASPIQEMKVALEYISNYVSIPLKTKSTNLAYHKLSFVQDMLLNDFLPHVGDNANKKAYFLGYMTNRLINVILGRQDYDDRDSFMNKRVETTGELMAELFKVNFEKMIRDMEHMVKNDFKAGRYDELGQGLAKKIKSTTIECGLKYALATGNWGLKSQPVRKGIAQVLSRLSYPQFMSHLRRLMATIMRTMKHAPPRMLHNTHWGYICPYETPEGASVGIVKNMAMTCNITMGSDDEPIRAYLLSMGVVLLDSVKPYDLVNNVKVFVNGDWLGIHSKPNDLVNEFRKLRRQGLVNVMTSISWNIKENEIRIFSDEGRLSRPLFIVKDNFVEMDLETIRNKSWEDLVIPKDGNEPMIEYLDVAEENTMMLAMGNNNLFNNKRDNKVFVKYTHREINPTVIVSYVISSIPYSNCNQAPRILYAGAQGKQAASTFATSFNHRMDTAAHVIYYPQKPLVSVFFNKITNIEYMPSGQNFITAIACFTGYNQEDSIMINGYSLDRGLALTSYYSKYSEKEKKNSTTLEDERFCKPEKFFKNGNLKTAGMKDANYEKLEESGFVKVGAKVEGGDVIIGKCIPFKAPAEDEPKFKDVSVVMKPGHMGVVDKVYSNKDGDGYRFVNVRVRSERKPQIGDKFACYTPDHDVLTQNRGWVPVGEITMDDRVACLMGGSNLEYVKPKKIMSYDCDEDVYEVNTNGVKLMVTKNHRMYVGDRAGLDFDMKIASQCLNKRYTYKKNVEHWTPKFTYGRHKNLVLDENEVIESFRLFDVSGDFEIEEFNIESWVAFFGLGIFKGIKMENGRIGFDSTTINLYKSVINSITELNEDGEIMNDNVCEYLKSMTDRLPNWVWFLSRRDVLTLISIMENNCSAGNANSFQTNSKLMADDYQRLCLHSGYSCNIHSNTGSSFRINRIMSHNTPLVNKNYVAKTDEGANDAMVPYCGKVFCCDVGGDGVIYVRRDGVPVWCGNSRHGQKGTCGMIYQQYDMPFSENGIIPDIILSPFAFPTRMTVGHLIECLSSKLGAIKGFITDGSPFEGFLVHNVAEALGETGLEPMGTELMYDPRSGEQMEARLFMGPTYYQRLKHMVADKIQSRALGTSTLLTRQPSEGIRRGGGLRFGEMERDVMIAHGTVRFLKERFYDNSDHFFVWLSRKTGLIAAVNPDKGVYNALYEENATDFVKVKIPYAFKLLIQELMTMSITPRLFTN